MTLIEIAFALPIVLVAFSMMLQTLTAGAGLREVGRETWIASGAAQDVLERMRNEDYRDVFRLYNADPFDDPLGPGTAPGNLFEVPALTAATPEQAGMVGEVEFAAWNTGSEVVPVWEVRENIADARIGTPRDLNGDSLIDDANHAEDFSILPVIVTLRWRGRFGPREFRLHTVLSELR
jgi:hypothetical protein